MQFALLIYEDEAIYGPDQRGPAMDDIVTQHRAFGAALGVRRVAGFGLKSATTATTVRTQNGAKTLHDGPFAEAREQLGGLYLIDVADLDAAIEIARQIPMLQDGSVEVRPVLEGG